MKTTLTASLTLARRDTRNMTSSLVGFSSLGMTNQAAGIGLAGIAHHHFPLPLSSSLRD
jgi:ABC-type Fe3+ transport system permease subunit